MTIVFEVLPQFLRVEAIERIVWHHKNGDRVVIVSASLDAYIEPWCDKMRLERICTELQGCNGTLTGAYRHGDCSGAAKVRRIRERYDLKKYDLIYAYGDSKDDHECSTSRIGSTTAVDIFKIGPMPSLRASEHPRSARY